MAEADTLLHDGWVPRIKTVKGRHDLTLRKGTNERSLGPYDKDSWSELSTRSGVTPKPPVEEIVDMNDALAKTLTTLAALRAELDALKADQASHLPGGTASACVLAETDRDHDTVCTKYVWDEEPPALRKMFPNVTFKRSAIKTGEDQYKWRFTPHAGIYSRCHPLDTLFFRLTRKAVDHVGQLKNARDYKNLFLRS
ncbi:MAG: hypothetical protein V1915_02305 [Candidatus Bathyarchaeota archaeon]